MLSHGHSGIPPTDRAALFNQTGAARGLANAIVQNEPTKATLSSGAPEEIRTPDPQIRRLLRVFGFSRIFLQKNAFIADW
jgi:hypothetical protein